VSLPIQTTPEAEAQIRAIDQWWRANRPRASALFLEELADALERIGNAPEIGRRYAPPVALRALARERSLKDRTGAATEERGCEMPGLDRGREDAVHAGECDGCP
jgi:plasmid stabilization system protein ParE